MAVITTNVTCELQEVVKVQYLKGNLFSQDVQANVINVHTFSGGEPVTLSGTVTASVIREDGGTVTATGGTISGNVVSITLPAAAYVVPGLVSIVIKVTASSVITTIAAVVANVYKSSTETAIDPGTIIPSVTALVAQIETAVASIPADYSSLWTSLAPAFSSSKSGGYKVGEYVTYNGGLYAFTADHSGSWNASHVEQTNIGVNLSTLKETSDEHTEALSILVYKRPVPTPPPTSITQCADISNARRQGSGTNRFMDRMKIDLPALGNYYMNPSGMGLLLYYAQPYDTEGNLLTLYRNGTEYSIGIFIQSGSWLELVNWRTFVEHLSNGNIGNTWTTDENMAYLAGDSIRIGYFSDENLNVGITYYGESTSYVPYEGSPDIQYEYWYRNGIGEFAYNYIIGNRLDDKPNSGSSLMLDSNGIYNAIHTLFENSYNLIDERYYNWDSPSGGYWIPAEGYYFPVTAGKKICTNVYKPKYYFYNNAKEQISSAGAVNPFTCVDIPANSVWCRMIINTASNVREDVEGKLLVYEVPATILTNDDRRIYVPNMKIIGGMVEGDIYNTAIPYSLDNEILLASQYRSVRSLNHQRNAFRIGTFNIFVTRQRNHWELLKKELKDFSVDICGFQEVANIANTSDTRILQNYLTLNTWQFKYASQPIFNGTLIDKAVVSMYEIVSTNYYNTSTNRPYIKTVIKLPQYKHIDHQFNLSIYDYHGSLVAVDRLTEVSEMLQVIEADTNDFIVIVGDTNAFESEADEQGKRPTWEAWKAAGFTPIHYGESPTVTDGSTSIDQIFMGQNISCLYYDVVNSNDYPLVISGNTVPISDHDFVYADLQFDFDAVLENLNE